MRLGTEGSGAEEYRSVIDDLTVENKKLKRRLKKYENLHDSHLKGEKLFEVRIHGLPPTKKRELEEMLRAFASDVGSTTEANVFPPHGYAGLPLHSNPGKAEISQTSLRNTDSAYASMSGHTSSMQSGYNDDKQKISSAAYLTHRQKNVNSYIHHIPEGLLPQQEPGTMSDRTRKELVARRMEQIFSGKGAVGGHLQPMQQQEVSQSAAQADRREIEALGQTALLEGHREAPIMKHNVDEWPTEEKVVSEAVEPEGPGLSKTRPRLNKTTVGDDSEQRPTRPLDVDPHRAQVPIDNVKYLQHMGFTPPDLEHARSPDGDHGWIYLNFLINMAQLHTLHVTSEFVRTALTEYSDRFELSTDGRKVRWRGGRSKVAIDDATPNDPADILQDVRPQKRLKLSHRHSNRSSSREVGKDSTLHRHVYTPLFFHRQLSGSSNDSPEEGGSQFQRSADRTANASSRVPGFAQTHDTGHGLRHDERTELQHDDGPIVFYHNARFYTDLSGDQAKFDRMSTYKIASTLNDSADEYSNPLRTISDLPEPMDLDDNPIPESMELKFPPDSPPTSHRASRPERTPVDLDVSGIGGVWPADNFALDVESRRARLDETPSDMPSDPVPRSIPPRFAKILQEWPEKARRPRTSFTLSRQITGVKLRPLSPAPLPPALNLMSSQEDSLEDETGSDELSVSSLSPHGLYPSTAPQPLNFAYGSSENEHEVDGDASDEDVDESDNEVDFLAGLRAVDPERVRAQELEYDAAVAERLAEEIPAGRSAATAGGGSGRPSPSSHDAARRPPTLQPSRTSDSMVPQGSSARSSATDGDDVEK